MRGPAGPTDSRSKLLRVAKLCSLLLVCSSAYTMHMAICGAVLLLCLYYTQYFQPLQQNPVIDVPRVASLMSSESTPPGDWKKPAPVLPGPLQASGTQPTICWLLKMVLQHAAGIAVEVGMGKQHYCELRKCSRRRSRHCHPGLHALLN